MQIHASLTNDGRVNRASTEVSRFLRACQRQQVDATPIWLMRQAGRYMANIAH